MSDENPQAGWRVDPATAEWVRVRAAQLRSHPARIVEQLVADARDREARQAELIGKVPPRPRVQPGGMESRETITAPPGWVPPPRVGGL